MLAKRSVGMVVRARHTLKKRFLAVAVFVANPTKHFTILEPQKPTIGVSKQRKVFQLYDFEALRL